MSSKDFLPDIMSQECHHARCYEKAEVALDWGWFIPCSRGSHRVSGVEFENRYDFPKQRSGWKGPRLRERRHISRKGQV